MAIFSIEIFGITLSPTWYGLMYAIWFGVCYLFVDASEKIKKKDMDILLWYIFIGVILWGRIGYVVLYQFSYYLSHPGEIFAVWEGGMSFHGGAIGVILGMFLFAHRYRYQIYQVSDPIVAILPAALFFGRIGNYINGELLGFPWYHGPLAIMRDGILHFPSTLLEAFLEGMLLLGILQYCYWRMQPKPGTISAIFLIWYGASRIISECFRLPDTHIGYLFGTSWMTIGMIYTIPMFLGGAYIWWYRTR